MLIICDTLTARQIADEGQEAGIEEEEEYTQNRTRTGRDSQRGRTSTPSRNAGFNQSADETRRRRSL